MDEISSAWYTRQSTIAARTTASVEALWNQVDPNRISESWTEQLAAAVQALTVGQLAAASQAGTYVTAQVQRQGGTPRPSGRLNPTAFAGVAADGRDLSSLLYLPAVTAKVRIGAGAPVEDAMLSARFSLLSAVQTETADAGRLATQAAQTSDTTIQGYRRMLVAPSCSRCIVLAGKFYRHQDILPRHPGCDCQLIPSVEAADLSDGSVNPHQAFAGMSQAAQDRSFGKKNAQAIRDGADIGQVVNARRGMSTPGAMTTLEGQTRRGAYARRNPGPGRTERKSVAYIYWSANGDRAEAIRLLKKYAYIL